MLEMKSHDILKQFHTTGHTGASRRVQEVTQAPREIRSKRGPSSAEILLRAERNRGIRETGARQSNAPTVRRRPVRQLVPVGPIALHHRLTPCRRTRPRERDRFDKALLAVVQSPSQSGREILSFSGISF